MIIAGYILAGGKNSRMSAGTECKKVFLEYQGKSFLSHCVQALSCVNRVYLSVEAAAPYGETGLPLVTDRYPQTGPLGGIYSGLCSCEEDALLVVPCDTPGITREVLQHITDKYRQLGCTVVAGQGRIHPLTGIYDKTCMPVMERMLAEQDYRMMELLRRIPHEVVWFKDEDAFKNINCPDDYSRLQDRQREMREDL